LVRFEGAAAAVSSSRFHRGEPPPPDIVELVARASAGLHVNFITRACPWMKRNSRAGGSRSRPLSTELRRRVKKPQQISGHKVHAQKLRFFDSSGTIASALRSTVVTPPQHRSTRGMLLSRNSSADADRIRQRPVLRVALLIVKNLRPPRTVKSFRRISETRTGKIAGKIPRRICRSGLLREVPKPCMGGWGRKLMLSRQAAMRCLAMPRKSSRPLL